MPVTAPQTQFYNNLGQECVQVGCSVSLFLVNNSYVDLPTLGQVVRLTGGEIHKYTYFQVRIPASAGGFRDSGTEDEGYNPAIGWAFFVEDFSGIESRQELIFTVNTNSSRVNTKACEPFCSL